MSSDPAQPTAQPPAEDVLTTEELFKLPFDQFAVAVIQQALRLVLSRPEIRSVFVGLDFAGDLNGTPGLQKFIWQTAHGPANRPAELVGSVMQCGELLKIMGDRVAQMNLTLVATLTEKLTKLKEAAAEHERLKQAIQQQEVQSTAATTLPGPGVSAG